MFLFMYIGIGIISYIVTFKSDFTDEHIEKAGPFVFTVSLLLITIGIIGSLSRG